MKNVFTASLQSLHGLLFSMFLVFGLAGAALAQDGEFPESGSNDEPVLEVNINKDGAEKMAELLAGIGPARALAIVEYREMHGEFDAVDDLTNVSGIGPATLDAIREQLVLQTAE